MSLYSIAYFKKHYFRNWGAYGIHYGPVHSNTAGKVRSRGTYGWMIPLRHHVYYDSNWFYSDSMGGAFMFKWGLPMWDSNFMDKGNGTDFVAKAINAKYAHLKGDSEEMWWLSSIMVQFLDQFQDFIKEDNFKKWQGVEWKAKLPYKDYGVGPWTKTIWHIITEFDKKGPDGKTMWETIFEVASKDIHQLNLRFAKAVKDNDWEDFANKFFLAYDLDKGGLDFSTTKWDKAKSHGDHGLVKGAYNQILAAQTYIDILANTNTYVSGEDRDKAPFKAMSKKQWIWIIGSQLQMIQGRSGIRDNEKRKKAKEEAGLLRKAEEVAETWGDAGKKIKFVFDAYHARTSSTPSSEYRLLPAPSAISSTAIAEMLVDRKNKIIELFVKTGLWSDKGEPPADLQMAKTWKQAIGPKVQRLVKRGLWLSPWWQTMSRLNLGTKDDKWLLYDQYIYSRVGLPYLSWGDHNGSGWYGGDGFKVAYGSCYSSSGISWKYQNKKGVHPEKFIWEGEDAVNLTADPWKRAFHDGMAAQKHGGHTPYIWSGIGTETKYCYRNSMSEMNRTGMGGGNATPESAEFVMSEEFWNGTDPPADKLREENINQSLEGLTGDHASFYKIKAGSALIKLKSYEDYSSYISSHGSKCFHGDTWSRDKGNYAHLAKWRHQSTISYDFGMQISETDKDTGIETKAAGQLARTYQVFKQEYRKNLELSGSEQRSAEELFEEATNYLAYSMAVNFLGSVRDEVFFTLADEFMRQTYDKETVSASELNDTLEAIETEEAKNAAAANAAARDAEKDDLSDEDIANRQAFYKQCFLLMNMDKLKFQYSIDALASVSGKKPSRIHDVGNEFKGRIRLIDTNATEGDKAAIINRLTSPKGDDIRAFFNARPELISALVPQIRLFRVQSEPKGDGLKLREVEFDFPKHNNPDSSQYKGDLQTSRDKWEFGIKEFSFSFDGTSPATARNDIKANLTLFFRDFNDLIKKRSLNEFTSYKDKNVASPVDVMNSKKNKYSYLDLILFPGSKHQGHADHPLQYNASQYRIRADVGWANPSGRSEHFRKICDASGTKPEELKSALEKINKSFYLNMVDHDLDFANDGSVTIKIEYRAYMESAAKSTSLDILSTPEINSIRRNLQSEMNTMWGKCDAQQMNELIQTYRTIETELLKKSYQSIITRLLRRQRMMYVYSDAKSRDLFSKLGFFEKLPNMYNGQKQQYTSNLVETEQVAMNASTTNEQASAKTFTFIDGELSEFNPTSHNPGDNSLGLEVVNYFFVGDLFYTLMDCMYEAPGDTDVGELVGKPRDDVKNTKLLLSSFKYKHPLDVSQDLEINIAEIPVAVDFFLEFINKNILEGERRSYPLMYFIRDFCNRLIVDLMNELCIKSIVPEARIRFQTSNLLALPVKPTDTDPAFYLPKLDGSIIRDVTMGHKDGQLPFIASLENRSIDDAYNYITIYPITSNMVTTDPGTAPKGIMSEDEANGIRHLFIGRPRGLVKTIKFSKVDMQYIREARYFNHGYNGLMQLGSVYKASVEMIGNTLFYPGMTIFINPVSLASEDMDPTQGGSPTEELDWDPNTGELISGNLPSIANALGIGGYHLITKVKSIIAPGKFNTTIDARFYYSGDGKSLQLQSPTKKKEGSGPTDREKTINSLEISTSGPENSPFCNSIIRIRQDHTGNLFESEFAKDFSGVDADKIESVEEDIGKKMAAKENALQQQKSLEQQQAAAEAYKARQEAIKEAEKAG